jgi:hypothetical protein
MSIKSKLYWIKTDPSQQKKISKALGKRKSTDFEIDYNPVLTKQIRQSILSKTEEGKRQLQQEKNKDAFDELKSMIEQRKYVMNELKNTMPELTDSQIKSLAQKATSKSQKAIIPTVQEPIMVKQIGKKSQEQIAEILKIIDDYYAANNKIPSKTSILADSKQRYGRVPWGATKSIEEKLASLGPQIELVETQEGDDQEIKISDPLQIASVKQQINAQSPKKQTNPVYQIIEDSDEDDGSGLKFGKIRGKGLISSIYKYGKSQISNAVKSKVQELHDKPLDAIEGAFKIGTLLRKEYLKANAKDEDIKKEIAGKLHIKIPKEHQTKILKALKKHPKMKELKGAGIWSSLAKGFTLPLRVISRLGTAIDLPVISQIAKGAGAISDIVTDAAGTTPLI